MAFGEEDMLGGLDLSVLEGIATAPAGAAVKKEEGADAPVEVEPGIFQPGLAIKEVDELPLVDPELTAEEIAAAELAATEAATLEAEAAVDPDAVIEPNAELSPEEIEAAEAAAQEDEDAPVLKVFADMQRDSGLINFKDEEFEDTEEWVLGKVQETIDSKVSEYKDSLPDEVKYLLENYEEGVSMTDLLNMNANEQSYASVTQEALEENVNLQKMLVKDLLSRSGWSEERIVKKLARYEDTGVLLGESEDALDSLKEIQVAEKENVIVNQKAAQKKKTADHAKWLGDLKEHISVKEEILPGFSLSVKDKDDLYKGITKLDRNGKNEIMRARETDPEFDLKIAYLATILKWDFSAFERQSTTKATKKLSDAIKNTKKTGSRPSRGNAKTVDFGTMRKSIT